MATRVKEAFKQFFRGYVDAALFSSTDESDESGGEPLDRNYTASDIATSTLRKMKKDCASFMHKNRAYLVDATSKRGYDDERAGADFWYTRNRHGVGYWDRDLGSVGDHLTKVAKKFGEYYLHVGDDGLIYG